MKTFLKYSVGIMIIIMINGCSDQSTEMQADNQEINEKAINDNSFTSPTEIQLVKQSVLEDYQMLTVGQAFDGWAGECQEKSWEFLTGDRGEKIVQFTCIQNVEQIKTNGMKKVELDIKSYVERNGIQPQGNDKLGYDHKKESLTHLQRFQIIQQFLLSVNGESFTLGYSGVEVLFDDGRTRSSPISNFITTVYNNEQINPYFEVNIAYYK